MEPIISDFGLDRLVSGKILISGHKESGSSRYFASLKSTTVAAATTTARESQLDVPIGGSPVGSSTTAISPYQAPESLKNLKPSPKWDVFSFGIILLELLTGRVFSDRELGLWTAALVTEDRNRALRLVDVAIRAEVESREDAMLACLKFGFSCASFAPQKRPTMKEALQVLDKIGPPIS
ncbi:hypothetical protein TIFTF001_007065 [Ficus carica]|uniref:Protein kinase domain-containing protein n=1 Tax=Ficus carica TaxID=3494 RepID=A0AA87ZP91_FICCA|nr:hypothetical protein TIFTF001_007065 [Ficus carica]